MEKEKKEVVPHETTSQSNKSKLKNEVKVNALVTLESDPLAITTEQLEQRMAIEQSKRRVLTDYVSANMKEGQDYGKIEIEGRDGKVYESKNTLFKPGSEKFCSLFGLRPVFRADIETLSMLGNRSGVVAYICELMTKSDKIVGEGRGVADINEKRNWSLNNVVKIAEKRAQIDAVLRSGGLSDFFTQDLEDQAEVKTNDSGKRQYVVGNRVSEPQLKFIFSIMRTNGITKESFEKWLFEKHNIIGIENMPKQFASKILDGLLKKHGEPKGQREDVPTVQVDEDDAHEPNAPMIDDMP